MNKTIRIKQHEVGWRCPKCRKTRQADNSGMGMGVDPCLGRLPGVIAACCGHSGRSKHLMGYVYFTNGTVIRFRECWVD